MLDGETLEQKVKPDRRQTKTPPESSIRFWSDFNRVYYIPRSIQRLPDPPGWENVEGDWDAGRALFRRYDQVTIFPRRYPQN